MKTEAWLCTVRPEIGSEWQCIFDFEINRLQAINKYEEVTGLTLRTEVSFRCEKIPYIRTNRDPLAVLPEVKSGVLFSLEQDMQRPSWIADMLALLSLNQPILHQYLAKSNEQHGEAAALVGLVSIRLLESQIEAEVMV